MMHEMHAFVAHIHVSKEFTAEFTDANVIISLVTFEQTRCAALFALSDARNNAINRFSFVQQYQSNNISVLSSVLSYRYL